MARLAGMPSDVVGRAWDLLQELEGEPDLSGSNTGYQLHMLPGIDEDKKSLTKLSKIIDDLKLSVKINDDYFC